MRRPGVTADRAGPAPGVAQDAIRCTPRGVGYGRRQFKSAGHSRPSPAPSWCCTCRLRQRGVTVRLSWIHREPPLRTTGRPALPVRQTVLDMAGDSVRKKRTGLLHDPVAAP